MPLSRYDKLLTSTPGKNSSGAGTETKAAFIKQYGLKAGTRNFYAYINAQRKKRGMTGQVPAPGSRRARSNP